MLIANRLVVTRWLTDFYKSKKESAAKLIIPGSVCVFKCVK